MCATYLHITNLQFHYIWFLLFQKMSNAMSYSLHQADSRCYFQKYKSKWGKRDKDLGRYQIMFPCQWHKYNIVNKIIAQKTNLSIDFYCNFLHFLDFYLWGAFWKLKWIDTRYSFLVSRSLRNCVIHCSWLCQVLFWLLQPLPLHSVP